MDRLQQRKTKLGAAPVSSKQEAGAGILMGSVQLDNIRGVLPGLMNWDSAFTSVGLGQNLWSNKQTNKIKMHGSH